MNGNVDGVMGAAAPTPRVRCLPPQGAPRRVRWGTMEKTVLAQRGPGKAAERFPAEQGGGGIAIRCYQDSPQNTPVKPSNSIGNESGLKYRFVCQNTLKLSPI